MNVSEDRPDAPGLDMTLVELQRGNPFRPTNWRWRAATYLHRSGGRPGRRWRDPAILRALKYLKAADRLGGRDHSRLVKMDPELVAALALHDDVVVGRSRLAIEARLLAGMTDAQIAERTGLTAEAVVMYRALFYDVGESLDATDHVALMLLGPSLGGHGVVDAATIVKLYSYFGGHHVADALLDLPAADAGPSSGQGGHTTANPPLASLFAMAVGIEGLPITERTIPKFLRLHARLSAIERRKAAGTVAPITHPVGSRASGVASGLDRCLPCPATGANSLITVRARRAECAPPDDLVVTRPALIAQLPALDSREHALRATG